VKLTGNFSQFCNLVFVGAALSCGLQASVYNVVTDFHDPTISTSVWSYGTSTTAGGTLTPFPAYTNGYFGGTPNNNPGQPSGDAGYYREPQSGNYFLPAILKNTTAGDLNFVNTVTWPNSVLLLHPGADGAYAVVRFTAPSTSTYSVQGLFVGLDHVGPTTTDVHVLPSNGDPGFSGTVNNFGVNHPFSFTTNLTAGQHIDFAVGFGDNQNLYYDSTGLSASISATPEPGFYGLMALGMAGLGTVVIRRRRNSTSAA
jgi:hypothetical protein